MRKQEFMHQDEIHQKLTKVQSPFVRKALCVVFKIQAGGTMVNRGGFSFVAMLVINPIVILFYQNCSMTPISSAANSHPTSAIRQLASEKQQPVSLQFKPGCQNGKQACIKAE